MICDFKWADLIPAFIMVGSVLVVLLICYLQGLSRRIETLEKNIKATDMNLQNDSSALRNRMYLLESKREKTKRRRES